LTSNKQPFAFDSQHCLMLHCKRFQRVVKIPVPDFFYGATVASNVESLDVNKVHIEAGETPSGGLVSHTQVRLWNRLNPSRRMQHGLDLRFNYSLGNKPIYKRLMKHKFVYINFYQSHTECFTCEHNLCSLLPPALVLLIIFALN
jgi:hypothetical protein